MADQTNSIHANQAEDTQQDLYQKEAIVKIRELVKSAQSCFFCTQGADRLDARPMNVRQVDDAGNLWFLSAAESHKNREIMVDPTTTLFFQGSAHSDFLHLTGRATITNDREKIRELWQPMIKTWFTEGVEDPRITAIKFSPDYGYYWDTKHAEMVAGIKIMIGAVLGKTMDDSIEGQLRV